MKRNHKDNIDRTPKVSKPIKASKAASSSKGKQKAQPNILPSPSLPSTAPGEIALLKLLASANGETLNSPTFTEILQAVKAALFVRDFQKAFSTVEYNRVYASRWAPSRALGYRSLMLELDLVRELFESGDSDETLGVVCVGGGAGSEIAALAALIKESGTKGAVNVTTVDIADWRTVLGEQAAALRAGFKLDDRSFHVTFSREDVLDHKPVLAPGATSDAEASISTDTLADPEPPIGTLESSQDEDLQDQLPKPIKGYYSSANLITILFTANELITASHSNAIAYFYTLTRMAKPGTLLLIVDSAGSYSEMKIPKSGKTYPMEFLLDYAFTVGWDCIRKEESKWYRLPEGLAEHYPLKLENM